MKTMKKAVLITCFEAYENRIFPAERMLQTMGYDVTVIESDFRHLQKERREDRRENLVFVSTKAYEKNLSVSRLYSHYCFSRDTFRMVEDYSPDLLYVVVPPNSLVKEAAFYKKRHPEVTLIFDILDLWPESLPMHGIEKTPPCKVWRNFRDKYLHYADFIFSECELFRMKLGKTLPIERSEVLYLSREITEFQSVPDLPEKGISLAYLGSINNIIDIPKICALVEELKKYHSVTVHVIGNGENRELFLDELKNAGARVEFYGEVYDNIEKQRIFDRCHFGLNIMKDAVCVGLTMKSIDYFEMGLPLISNIPGDTAKLIEEYNAGIIYNKAPEKIAKEILPLLGADNLSMRKNSRTLFEVVLSDDRYDEILKKGFESGKYIK